MKKLCIIFIVLVSFSCKNDSNESQEIEVLKGRIQALENKNQILRDSLKDIRKTELQSSRLVAFPDELIMTFNKPNRIQFLFQRIGGKDNYKVYRKFKDGHEEVLKLESTDETMFAYIFTPKNEDDRDFEIRAEFQIGGKTINVPGLMHFSNIK
jgi:hypothetical protein